VFQEVSRLHEWIHVNLPVGPPADPDSFEITLQRHVVQLHEAMRKCQITINHLRSIDLDCDRRTASLHALGLQKHLATFSAEVGSISTLSTWPRDVFEKPRALMRAQPFNFRQRVESLRAEVDQSLVAKLTL
jgi:hypothetical protein